MDSWGKNFSFTSIENFDMQSKHASIAITDFNQKNNQTCMNHTKESECMIIPISKRQ